MNFTNIVNAIKAIDGVKNKPEYANLRIAHGKDRCANPPRSGPQGGSGGRRMASGGHGHGHAHVHGHGQVNGVGMGAGGEEEMQFLNGEMGEEDAGVLDAIAELGDVRGDEHVGGSGEEMHVDGKEPAVPIAAVPIITTAVVG